MWDAMGLGRRRCCVTLPTETFRYQPACRCSTLPRYGLFNRGRGGMGCVRGSGCGRLSSSPPFCLTDCFACLPLLRTRPLTTNSLTHSPHHPPTYLRTRTRKPRGRTSRRSSVCWAPMRSGRPCWRRKKRSQVDPRLGFFNFLFGCVVTFVTERLARLAMLVGPIELPPPLPCATRCCSGG